MSGALIFLAGLVGLLIGGHLLITGATSIGRRFGMSPAVIGLTIIAGGTSAPELAVFYQAIAADDTSLAVGSIIGSNIANVLLVAGAVAALGAVKVSSTLVRVDVPVMAGASAGLLLLTLDGTLGRIDGLLLFAGLITFVGWTLRARTAGAVPVGEEVEGEPAGGLDVRRLPVALLAVVAGVVGLVFAAGFVVAGAEEIAAALGIPELIVGLTIVALGTSAPEITTSLLAALRGDRELALGNALGSNIFNILLVLGLSGLLSPRGVEFGEDAVRLDLPILVAAALACLPIMFWDHTVDRWEGFVFLLFYGAYLVFLVLDGTDRLVADPLQVAFAVFVVPLGLLGLGVAIAKARADRLARDRLPGTGPLSRTSEP